MRNVIRLAIAAGASLWMTQAALAADPVEQHNSTALWFVNWFGLENAILRVNAPDGRLHEVAATSGTPVFELPRSDAPDGVYRYELTAATDEREAIVNPIDNGRGDAANDSVAKPFYRTGHFTVSRGVIVVPEDIEEDAN
ncbi:hypothetical protein [Citreimonas sp.]|uniref:hypothetical protein n=1 Tax=Citreimonas sp. TaxID=3036715 RepID=UPI0035C7C03F